MVRARVRRLSAPSIFARGGELSPKPSSRAVKSDAHQVHGRFRDGSDFAWTQSLPRREEEDFLLALGKSF
jgi:hypothetical protein